MAEFRFREKFLYRMGHDVGCAVAENLPFLFTSKIVQLDPTPFVQDFVKKKTEI